MKTIACIFLVISALTASAQNWAALYIGPNTNGVPTNYPVSARWLGTNTAVQAGEVRVTDAQLKALVSAGEAAYRASTEAARSNALWSAQAKLDADMADFLAKMDKIETWIDRTSGTNSLSNSQRDNAINDICQTFKKLRPILKSLYQQSQ